MSASDAMPPSTEAETMSMKYEPNSTTEATTTAADAAFFEAATATSTTPPSASASAEASSSSASSGNEEYNTDADAAADILKKIFDHMMQQNDSYNARMQLALDTTMKLCATAKGREIAETNAAQLLDCGNALASFDRRTSVEWCIRSMMELQRYKATTGFVHPELSLAIEVALTALQDLIMKYKQRNESLRGKNNFSEEWDALPFPTNWTDVEYFLVRPTTPKTLRVRQLMLKAVNSAMLACITSTQWAELGKTLLVDPSTWKVFGYLKKVSSVHFYVDVEIPNVAAAPEGKPATKDSAATAETPATTTPSSETFAAELAAELAAMFGENVEVEVEKGTSDKPASAPTTRNTDEPGRVTTERPGETAEATRKAFNLFGFF